MIIDAHAHLQGSQLHPQVIEECDAHGVDTIMVSSIAGYQHYPSLEAVQAANADLYAVHRDHPDFVACYCYVNPRHGSAALEDLRRNVEERGMVGIKLWVATTADDPLVDPVVEQAIEYRIPILMHAWRKTAGQLPYESNAQNIARIGARYPEARIIMAHLGGQVETAMNTIAPYPNIRTDTSGTPINSGAVRIAVDRLGAERVVFGSDLHGVCMGHSIGKVVAAELRPEESELVMGATMAQLLKEVRS
ncbi:amidohydrolase family protein [Ruania zhangjianzhongii]|uniref:amidohydrolase family protein n=1 Tax=Ruania zhangjianzhongii TaxID=2603206 RepID=UPI00143DB798|nr:amidohydrolase family protein [Ruania zhangjianzhongii]